MILQYYTARTKTILFIILILTTLLLLHNGCSSLAKRTWRNPFVSRTAADADRCCCCPLQLLKRHSTPLPRSLISSTSSSPLLSKTKKSCSSPLRPPPLHFSRDGKTKKRCSSPLPLHSVSFHLLSVVYSLRSNLCGYVISCRNVVAPKLFISMIYCW